MISSGNAEQAIKRAPLRTAAEPLFKLLSEPKRMVLYDGGHVPPLDVLMSATSEWLGDNLGRVFR